MTWWITIGRPDECSIYSSMFTVFIISIYLFIYSFIPIICVGLIIYVLFICCKIFIRTYVSTFQ